MTDREIGLAKAMLSQGMANDHIHFYFNRSDRLISSGRIAQIKTGKYGSEVPEAPIAELNAFIQAWETAQNQSISSSKSYPHDEATIRSLFSLTAEGWTMRIGETDHAECKLSFQLNPDYRFADSLRTIAGLANNRGGYLLYGVRNKPFIADRLKDDAFQNTDLAVINRIVVAALDPAPRLFKTSLLLGETIIGAIYVEPHDHAPVIAMKNIANDLKEGAIYYRYPGETRLIKPGELRQILSRREQRAIAEFTERITRVANGEVATIDMGTGEVRGTRGRFLIDHTLLPNLQFIREGEFDEVKGSPTLRLVGEVQPTSLDEHERIKVIRDSITPDAVVRNFLNGTKVQEPLQYIQAQAHAQRKWQPIWHYVKHSGERPSKIAANLKAALATNPSSRDAVVERLLNKSSAYKVHAGKPKIHIKKIMDGEFSPPTSTAEDMQFALAVQGLPSPFPSCDALKLVLLEALDRAQGADAQSSNRRSAIYRAACRLDELLNKPT